MRKGIFIVLEGTDGAGKSTIANMIAEYLKDFGIEIIFSREPGGTPISEKIRDILLDRNNTEIASTTEALLYAASRAQHVAEKIKPALDEGKTIICERFYYSSIVYQGIGRDLGIENVKAINDFAVQNTKPDLVLFIDIDPRVALKRKKDIDGGDRLENESIEFHLDVYEGYKKIIKLFPEIITIDGNREQEQIFADIKTELEKLLL